MEAGREQERELELQLLARKLRPEADFTDLAARSREAVTQCQAGQGHARALSRLLAEAPDQDRATLAAGVSRAIGTPVPVGRSATYVEMLASGEMALVRSEALRGALVGFDEQVRRHELAYDSLSALTTDNAGVLLETAGLAASPAAPRLEAALRRRLESAELAAASELMALVNARNCFWFEGVSARADAVSDVLGRTR